MATQPLKVLIVDDALMVRHMLGKALSADSRLQVIGTASNGRRALELVSSQAPDVVTLDVEMPEMDGLETLKQLRTRFPKLPVIMVSALTERGAGITLDCLSAGASDYITKPSALNGGAQGLDNMVRQLREKIELLVRIKGAGRPVPVIGLTGGAETGVRVAPRSAPTIHAVGVAVSTGGPNTLSAILPRLPRDLSVPVFITQHMPPMFTRILAERLTKLGSLPVYEAVQGQEIGPGQVYIAPGDFHLELGEQSGRIVAELTQGPPENSCRPAADVMFRSLSRVYGSNLLLVVLTGMGYDGTAGVRIAREQGAYVIAQDEETSVVWGMPGSVVRHNLCDEVLPMDEIGQRIGNLINASRSIMRHQGLSKEVRHGG